MDIVNPRPFFLPAGLAIEDFPLPVQVAINDIIQPAYKELVLQAPNALERSAGSAFVFLCLMELLEEFDIGEEVARRLGQPHKGKSARCDDSLNRCLRIMGAKEKAGTFLLRLRTHRAKRLPTPPFPGFPKNPIDFPLEEIRSHEHAGTNRQPQ
jgi:hypothetical protein